MNRVRLALCVVVFCGLSVAGMTQEDRTTVVTAAAPVDKVRFAGSLSAVQMRIEVRSPGGALIYDSDWKDGNILDWLPHDNSGQPLGFGAYRLLMQSKNLAGQTSAKEVALRMDSSGISVADQPSPSPKITLTAHDGETGQLITTNGDLSFRFGDFLNRKDTEVMRLTAAGELNVDGLIRAKGVVFPDGTILTTATGVATGDGGSVMRQRPSAPGTPSTPNRNSDVRHRVLLLNPPAVPAARLTPRPNFTPAFQFVVGDSGVSVGTTNLAYRLDVTGVINTGTEYDIGGVRFAHNFGTNNTFLGVNAGSISGVENTAVGFSALSNNTSGAENVGIGVSALYHNTTGSTNDAIGRQALYKNNGYNNQAMGWAALYSNLSGNYNVAIGDNALYFSTVNDSNVAIGSSALYSKTTGGYNIALGDSAGANLTAGSYNIDIGNIGGTTESNTIRIGTSPNHGRAFIAGIRGVTVGADALNVVIDSTGQLGTTVGVPSSRRYKFDINSIGDSTERLMSLRPVTFRYLAHGDNAPLQYGLIAEEVAEIYPEMVTRNKDGEVETVMYQFLAPMLLNEVQKQHRQIEEQQKTIEALNTTLAQRTTEDQTASAALRDELERLMRRIEQLEGKRATSK
jgi:polyhydroxyalkanoate synthesis regulator phasin